MPVLRSFVRRVALVAWVVSLSGTLGAQERTRPFGTQREQAEQQQRWLRKRMDTILPGLMRAQGIDFWVIPMREYNEDPTFSSLVSPTTFYARRRTIYVFFDRCAASGRQDPGDGSCLERLALGGSSQGGVYREYRAKKVVQNPVNTRQAELWGDSQWQVLKEVVEERNPRVIAINVSRTHAFSDGLTAGEMEGMSLALGRRWTARFKRAEELPLQFIASRLPEEEEFYTRLTQLVHSLIGRMFSNEVITPGVTTTQDLVWWWRQQVNDLGLSTWFQPSVAVQRKGTLPEALGDNPVVEEGDVLWCDVGITALGLNTDTQHSGYVLREGETEPPLGLRKALAKQETQRTHLGRILVDSGALSEDELRVQLEDKAQETIFGLFDWDDAEFRFADDETAAPNILAVDMRVEDILLRGAQRWDEMQRFRSVFNNPGIVLARTERVPPAEVFRNRMARRIFESIDGERSVAEILLHAHGSEYLVTKFLYELHRAGVVEIVEIKPVIDAPSPPPASAPMQVAELERETLAPEVTVAKPAAVRAVRAARAPELGVGGAHPATPSAVAEGDLEFARRLLSRGEFDSALEILDRAYKAQPSDEALRRLLAEAEASFIEKAYRHFLPPTKIVTLHRVAESLTAEQLSPTEFFLLSRIDGTWDIRSIIQITPLREVDVLRTLKRMREKGLIDLKDPVPASA